MCDFVRNPAVRGIARRGARRRRVPVIGTLLLVGLSAFASPVRAEDSPEPTQPAAPTVKNAPAPRAAPVEDPRSELASEKARVLFQRGRELVAESRYGEACETFERSLTFERAIGTKFNLADCYEHIGRVASAQELFTEVALNAHAVGQAERERVARERAASLEPRLSRLVVAPTVAPRELRIRRNGRELERALWGKALPVDPGAYDIEASSGSARWHQRVEITGQRSTVWVLVPALTASALDASLSSPRVPLPTATPASRSALDWKRAGPVVVGLSTVGLAGLAAGTAFALKYRSNNERAKDICRLAVCTADDIERHDQLATDARASRTGAFIGFGVAGASLVGAAAAAWGPWWRHREGAPSTLQAAPVLGAGRTWGLAAEGSF